VGDSDKDKLPLTRQWVEDYLRFGTGPRLERGLLGVPFEQWVRDNPPPDLQELVSRFGSYTDIPAASWKEFDRAMLEWDMRRKMRRG
jgi:hypothetical protein